MNRPLTHRIIAEANPWRPNEGYQPGHVGPMPHLHRIMANEQPRIAEDGPFPWRAWAIASLIGLGLLAVVAAFALWMVS